MMSLENSGAEASAEDSQPQKSPRSDFRAESAGPALRGGPKVASIAPALGLPLILTACGGGGGGGGGGRPAPLPAPPPAPGASADAGSVAAGAAATTGNVLSNDTPAQGQNGAATVTAVAVQGGAAGLVGQPIVTDFGTLTLNSNGSYSYAALDNAAVKALTAGQSHTDVFTYVASNGSGSAPSTLTVTITGVNDAPVATADSARVVEDAPTNRLTGNVLANDSDPDAGATLAIAQVNGDGTKVGQAVIGTYGTLTLNADGSYSYVLDNADADTDALTEGQIAQDVFSYQVSDGVGGMATAQITIAVEGRDITANDDEVKIDASVSTIAVFPLFSNDLGTGLRLTALQLPNGSGMGGAFPQALSSAVGTLTVNEDGSASYAFTGGGWKGLGAGQSYTDIFSYTVREIGGKTDTATLQVTIARPADKIVDGTAAGEQLRAGLTDTVVNGGGGDDVIIGSYGSDVLNGGAGNDRLSGWINDQLGGRSLAGRDQFSGGAGDDVIVGGNDNLSDTAIYAGKRSDYSVQIVGSQIIVRDLNLADGDEGTDTLAGIELLQFSDQIVAQFQTGNNFVVLGQGLRDTAVDLSGSRSFSVGALGGNIFGYDPTAVQLLTYDGKAAPSWLGFDLASQKLVGTAPAGFEGVVNLVIQSSVDGVTAAFDTARLYFYSALPGDTIGVSNASETFAGTSGPDRIFHMGRGDRAIASAGADIYEGSASENTAGAWPLIDYSGSDAGINLDLNMGTAHGGYAEGDTLLNIGSIIGSAYDDQIIGSLMSEVIDPGAGNDYVVVRDFLSGDPQSVYSLTQIWGGPGADVIEGVGFSSGKVDYSRSAAGISVTLGERGSGGDAEGDLLINIYGIVGSDFDDVIRLKRVIGPNYPSGSAEGGAGNDLLEGNNGYNSLIGGSGNDKMYGFAGDDLLSGGAGADVLDGGEGMDEAQFLGMGAVQIDLTAGTAHGGDAEGDILTGIENVFAGGYTNDILRGDAANNVLTSQGGNDQMYGMAGNDTLASYFGSGLFDGGDGVDTFRGIEFTTIDLAAGTATKSLGSAVLISIENVEVSAAGATAYGNDDANQLRSGTNGDVFLFGRGGDDRLIGGYGNDMLAGGTGADRLDGFEGIDTASYADSSAGVRVDLRNGQGVGGDAAGDTLLGIENLTGSAFADTLAGSGAVNSLYGNGGDDVLVSIGMGDTLNGGDGNDLLVGGAQNAGAGNDIMVTLDGRSTSGTGGAGADIFVLDTSVNEGAAGYNLSARIQDFSRADGDRIDLSDLRDGNGNVLSLQNLLDHDAVNGGNLEIDLSAFTSSGQAISGKLTLVGIGDPSQLAASDFIFSGGIDWQAQVPSGLSLT